MRKTCIGLLTWIYFGLLGLCGSITRTKSQVKNKSNTQARLEILYIIQDLVQPTNSLLARAKLQAATCNPAQQNPPTMDIVLTMGIKNQNQLQLDMVLTAGLPTHLGF